MTKKGNHIKRKQNVPCTSCDVSDNCKVFPFPLVSSCCPASVSFMRENGYDARLHELIVVVWAPSWTMS